MPARIGVDVSEIRDRRLNPLVQSCAGFDRQFLSQLGVLLVEVLTTA